jgi:hypothetical protein
MGQVGKKKSGMHCCIPDGFNFFAEPYLFFFLAFFFAAILFLLSLDSRFAPVGAGGARVQTHV